MALTWNGMGVTVKIWDKYFSCCIHLFPIQTHMIFIPNSTATYAIAYTQQTFVRRYTAQLMTTYLTIYSKIIKIHEWQKHV